MAALMEFTTESGETVTVEVDRHAPGAQLVARDGHAPARAERTFDEALQGIRSAAESALSVFRDGTLKPDGVELEFGVKITGAVIAKSALEGHLTVKLSWSPGASAEAPPAPGAPPAA